MRKTRPTIPPELDHLELTIRRLIESHDTWSKRATAAETRVRELETAMQEMATGSLDPVAMAEDVRTLQESNAVLQDRLIRAHAAVERMMARLQFTAEER